MPDGEDARTQEIKEIKSDIKSIFRSQSNTEKALAAIQVGMAQTNSRLDGLDEWKGEAKTELGAFRELRLELAESKGADKIRWAVVIGVGTIAVGAAGGLLGYLLGA